MIAFVPPSGKKFEILGSWPTDYFTDSRYSFCGQRRTVLLVVTVDVVSISNNSLLLPVLIKKDDFAIEEIHLSLTLSPIKTSINY